MVPVIRRHPKPEPICLQSLVRLFDVLFALHRKIASTLLLEKNLGYIAIHRIAVPIMLVGLGIPQR